MKLKRYSLAALASGVVLFVGSFVVPFILTFRASAGQGSVGIIGGADGPTAQFLTMQLLSRWPGCLAFLSAALVLSGLFCMFFSKTVTQVCSVKTSAVALGLSAIGGAGLYCFFLWLAMTAFHETGKHPIAYPVSVAGGVLCLTGFLGLLVLYFRERKQKWCWGGIAIDVATAVIYLPAFLCAASCVHQMLGG
jgi:hypothetical protein